MSVPKWKERQRKKPAAATALKLPCPDCASSNTGVYDSRGDVQNDVPCIRRRRVCYDCQSRFVTFETYAAPNGDAKQAIRGAMNGLRRLLKDMEKRPV